MDVRLGPQAALARISHSLMKTRKSEDIHKSEETRKSEGRARTSTTLKEQERGKQEQGHPPLKVKNKTEIGKSKDIHHLKSKIKQKSASARTSTT